MKPCNLLVLIFAACFFTTHIISQVNINTKQRQDIILKSYEKKFTERDKRSSDALFLSFKGGYHYDLPDNDYGLKGNWEIDASVGVIMNNNWIFGANFDYWKTTVNNYHLESSNIVLNRYYKGEGVNFFLKYGILMRVNKYNLELGAGIGPYRISYRDVNENFEGHGYLNLNARLGFNMKILDFQIGAKNLDLFISSEVAYYSLITFAIKENLHSNPIRMLNFKLGPTINLYY